MRALMTQKSSAIEMRNAILRNYLKTIKMPACTRKVYVCDLICYIIELYLRTFALIVSAHPYCARKSTCHAMPRHMHRARALSAKMNNDRTYDH